MTVPATDLSDLDVTRDAHVAALNAGDADGWVACFDPDAAQMPPNERRPGHPGALAQRTAAGLVSRQRPEARAAVDADDGGAVQRAAWCLPSFHQLLAFPQETA